MSLSLSSSTLSQEVSRLDGLVAVPDPGRRGLAPCMAEKAAQGTRMPQASYTQRAPHNHACGKTVMISTAKCSADIHFLNSLKCQIALKQSNVMGTLSHWW